MQTQPARETTPDTQTGSLTLTLNCTSSHETPLEYSDTPSEIALTITNTTDTTIEPGEAYLELITTAHAIATPPPTTFAQMNAPNTWELTETLHPNEALTTTLTLARDGLNRDAWSGQLDIIANVGMTITDKKTAFIYG